jgi:dextranase
MYVEVWKPDTSWRDLWRIVVEAQRLSGEPVVLAAYIDPAREHNVRLADAIIFASGGSHIELGEPGGLLADPYFPKYGWMSAALAKTLRAYYDFAVRYENILSIGAHDATDEWRDRVRIESASEARRDVWPIVREGEGFTSISLINLTALAFSEWTAALPTGPAPLESPRVHIRTERRPARAWFASPDGESLSLAPAAPSIYADGVTIDLPRLICWTLIWLEWER